MRGATRACARLLAEDRVSPVWMAAHAPVLSFLVFIDRLYLIPPHGRWGVVLDLWLVVMLGFGTVLWQVAVNRRRVAPWTACGIHVAALGVSGRCLANMFFYVVPKDAFVTFDGYTILEAYPDPHFQLLRSLVLWAGPVAFVVGWAVVVAGLRRRQSGNGS